MVLREHVESRGIAAPPWVPRGSSAGRSRRRRGCRADRARGGRGDALRLSEFGRRWTNERFLRHEEALAFERSGATFPASRDLAWYRGVRAKFVAYSSKTIKVVDGDFPFALYLRLFSDAIMEDLIEVDAITWLGAMVAHGAEALLCRYYPHDPEMLLLLIEMLLNTGLVALCLFGATMLRKGSEKNWTVPSYLERGTVRFVQSLVLCEMYPRPRRNLPDPSLHGLSMSWAAASPRPVSTRVTSRALSGTASPGPSCFERRAAGCCGATSS